MRPVNLGSGHAHHRTASIANDHDTAVVWGAGHPRKKTVTRVRMLPIRTYLVTDVSILENPGAGRRSSRRLFHASRPPLLPAVRHWMSEGTQTVRRAVF